jgi:ribosomal protein S18 acetylase RimI-like enzyme
MEFRAFVPSVDTQALNCLIQELKAKEIEDIVPFESDFLNQLALISQNPKISHWVMDNAEKGNGLVAHAWTCLNPQAVQQAVADIEIHPRWQDECLASTLLKRILHQARFLHAAYLSFHVDSKDSFRIELLRQNKFTSVGTYTILKAPIEQRIPPIVVPVGYTIVPIISSNDLELVTQTIFESYADLWGRTPTNLVQINASLPSLTQSVIFLTFSERGKSVGFCLAEARPALIPQNGKIIGRIEAPGIIPRHRRLDLYRALLLTGFQWLKQQRVNSVFLESSGDNPAVLEMYKDLGFSIYKQVTEYRFTIP